MATTTTAVVTLTSTGDDPATRVFSAAANQASPVNDQLVNLANGVNTFTVPTAGTITRVTIIPPAGNTTSMVLKGLSGDTGVSLHRTDWTSIGLDNGVAQIVITTGGIINNVRILWS